MTKRDILTIILLAAATLATSLAMVWFITERIPHLEDEMTYLFQARTFARGYLTAPRAPDKSSFFIPFVLEIDRRMLGKYPIGWPLLLALGERVNLGWLVNPVLAAATVVLIYLIGRKLFDRDAATIAGILALTSPFFLIQSSSYMSHTATLFWLTMALWAWLHTEESPTPQRWAALVGVALGMMFITRQLPTLTLILAFGLMLIIRLLRRETTIPELLRVYWPLALPAVLIGALQPLYLWVTTGDPQTNLYTLVWSYDRIGFGPGFGPYEGHTLQQGLITTRQDLRLLTSELFGLPRFSWVPVVLGLIVSGIHLHRERKLRWLLPLVLPFLLLVTIHVGYWVGAKVYGPRYYYEGLTGLVLLSGAGLAYTSRWLSERITAVAHIWPAYAVLIGMLIISAAFYLPGRLDFWHGMYGITREPTETLYDIRQTNEVIVMVRGCCWSDYGMLFYLNNPWYDGEIVVAHDKSAFQARVLIEQYFPEREVWYYNAGEFTKQPAPYDEE